VLESNQKHIYLTLARKTKEKDYGAQQERKTATSFIGPCAHPAPTGRIWGNLQHHKKKHCDNRHTVVAKCWCVRELTDKQMGK
jgi:hypothetical protein